MNAKAHAAIAALLRRLCDQTRSNAALALHFVDLGKAANLQEDATILESAIAYHLAQAEAKALAAVETAPRSVCEGCAEPFLGTGQICPDCVDTYRYPVLGGAHY